VCKWLICICGILCSVWMYKSIARFCSIQTDDFTIHRISSTRAFNSEWEVHTLSSEEQGELSAAFNQEYHYFARGNQAFAFISGDGNYIVKFFNQRIFALPFPWNFIPRSWIKDSRRGKKARMREDKLRRDFTSYRIAFDELEQETGLVFVHLNRSDWIKKKLRIYDKLKIGHQIDLDSMEFIVQKRAVLVYPYIDQLMTEGKEEEAKMALDKILQLFVVRCQKGIDDSEPDLDKNFGFIGQEAMQIDAGRFAKAESKVALPPIKDSFKKWLARYPSLALHFEQEYERLRS
jgi:hypothetical protein